MCIGLDVANLIILFQRMVKKLPKIDKLFMFFFHFFKFFSPPPIANFRHKKNLKYVKKVTIIPRKIQLNLAINQKKVQIFNHLI
jgi:hypothetical protein